MLRRASSLYGPPGGLGKHRFHDLIDGSLQWASDTFNGPAEMSVNTEKWTALNGPAPSHKTGRIRLEASSSRTTHDFSSRNAYKILGDFEAQVFLEIITGPSTNTWYSGLRLRDADSANFFYCGRYYENGHKIQAYAYTGSYTLIGTASNSQTSIGFRFTRAGNVIAAYFWDGSSWVQIGSNHNYGAAPNVFVEFYLICASGNPSVAVEWHRLQIHSGAIVRL